MSAAGLGGLVARANGLGVLSTGSFRALGLAVGALVNLAMVALLARTYGPEVYAFYALVSSFVFLLPFADLGLGASVVNDVSDVRGGRLSPDDYRRRVGRTRDLVVLAGLVVVAADVVLLLTGVWARLLGSFGAGTDTQVAVAVAFGLVAASVPFGLGNRVLQGAGRMRDVALIGVAAPVVVLVGAATLYALDAPGPSYAVVPAIGYLVVAVVASWWSARVVTVPRVPLLARRGRAVDGTRTSVELARVAVPFFVVSVGMAAGFQSHRLVLGTRGTAEDVAEYSLVAQFAGPALSVLLVVGQNLWSRYRTRSATAELTWAEFRSHVGLFGAVAVVGAVLVAVLGPSLGTLVAGGTVRPGWGVGIAAAAYVVVVGLHQPGAMLLNDAVGLRQQAVLVVVSSTVALAAMTVLVPVAGAAVPYAALAASMLVLQVLPTWRIARRRIAHSAEQVTRGGADVAAAR